MIGPWLHPVADGPAPQAVIVPHAGYVFSGDVAASAFNKIPRGHTYKRIFLLGPSHYEWVDGASVNIGVEYYATPLGNVKVDCETTDKLVAADSVFKYKARAHDREHCLEVQLPFLLRRLDKMPAIVPIIVSTNDYSKLRRIAEVLKPFFKLSKIGAEAPYPDYQITVFFGVFLSVGKFIGAQNIHLKRLPAEAEVCF